MIVVGLHTTPIDLFPTLLVLGESELIGSGTYCDTDFDAVIEGFARGDYPTDGWVTHAPIDDVVTVLNDLKEGLAIKVLIDL